MILIVSIFCPKFYLRKLTLSVFLTKSVGMGAVRVGCEKYVFET